jgi:hypothetical protein
MVKAVLNNSEWLFCFETESNAANVRNVKM